MAAMTIEQAKKMFEEINQDFEKGTINFDKIDKFLFKFIELMNDEFSQTNTNLFAGFVSQYIQTNHKLPKSLKDLLRLAKIYIDIMETPSKYETEPVTII